MKYIIEARRVQKSSCSNASSGYLQAVDFHNVHRGGKNKNRSHVIKSYDIGVEGPVLGSIVAPND